MSPPRRTTVAYIVDSFRYGGLERCVARLVNGLDEQRFRTVVISLKDAGQATEWVQREVPIHELHKKPRNDWSVVRRLADVLRDEQIDVVHSHNWATLIETTLARRIAKTPMHVHSQRGMFFHGRTASPWKQTARRIATRWACRRTDQVIAVADSVRQEMSGSWGIPCESIQVIPNGIDEPEHDKTGWEAARLRDSLGVGSDAIVIGSVGRLVSVKNFSSLIQAVSRIRSVEQPVHLIIVGDGPEMLSLSQAVQAEGLSGRVHLVGEQSNVGDWLQAMDVYVNSSLSEGMSQSVLEAMSLGLPIVATDVGANGELVSTEPACGLITLPGKPESLAVALNEMMCSERRSAFGRRAEERHRSTYDLHSMIATYEKLYESLSPLERPLTQHEGRVNAIATESSTAAVS